MNEKKGRTHRAVLKKFAVWAHECLVQSVSARIAEVERASSGCKEGEGVWEKASGELEARRRFLSQLESRYASELSLDKRRKRIVESIAYDLYKYAIGIRFLEINQFLPNRVRIFPCVKGNISGEERMVFSHHAQWGAGAFDFLWVDEAERERFLGRLKCGDDELAFRQVFKGACRYLHGILPGYFSNEEEGIWDFWTLSPGDKEGWIFRLVMDVDERLFLLPSVDKRGMGCVENLGWLYQYYHSDWHESVVDPIGKTVISREDIPAATQVFTPDWLVSYMVDNTLGRYWLEHCRTSRLREKLLWIQSEVKAGSVAREQEKISPESIAFLDPCVGSGHILVYAFDVFLSIYRECGYTDRDAVLNILQKNLYGIDIDERAVSLAYMVLMMKGRELVSDFFDLGVEPQVYGPGSEASAGEFGALMAIQELGLDRPKRRGKRAAKEPDRRDLKADLRSEIGGVEAPFRGLLRRRYDIVVTNPPYLNKYNEKLKKYIQKYYYDYRMDLFSVFIYIDLLLCKENGYCGYMTPNVWMFLKSYRNLRCYLMHEKSIVSLVQLAKGAFFKEAAVDICSFIIQNSCRHEKGYYIRLESFSSQEQPLALREALRTPYSCKYGYWVEREMFYSLPDLELAYWIDARILEVFKRGRAFSALSSVRQGLATTENRRFLRFWFEIEKDLIGFGCESCAEAKASGKKWFPYNKGGDFRKWYGNALYVVDYENDGEAIKSSVMRKYPYLSSPDYVVKNTDYYFKPSASWSKVSSGTVAFRYYPRGFLFDVAGGSSFYETHEECMYYLGFLNSVVCAALLESTSPTLNYEIGQIRSLPIIEADASRECVVRYVVENVALSREDWDCCEISWDFKRHPLVRKQALIEAAYGEWESECEARFRRVHANETALNAIFISLYGLEGLLLPEVDERRVRIMRANRYRDMQSLVSYGVGCLLGRYDVSRDGVQGLEVSKDGVACLVVSEGGSCQGASDIVDAFYRWLEETFGATHLKANASFIADGLGGKDGDARVVLRRYFDKTFYAYHVKMYQKRPIYWQFESGEQGGYRALVYSHRWSKKTLSVVLESVGRVLSRYEKDLEALENGDAGSVLSEARDSLSKKIAELKVYQRVLKRGQNAESEICLNRGIEVNYRAVQCINGEFYRFLSPLERMK